MRYRVWTAIIAMPLVLGAVFCAKHLPISVLALGCLAWGLAELEAMCKASRWVSVAGFVLGSALIGVAALAQAGIVISPLAGAAAIGLGLAGVVSTWALFRTGRAERYGLAASLWISAPLAIVTALHRGATGGGNWWNWASPLLLLLFPLWAGDSAAIFVGKAFGRRPLAPEISPKKTVEGAVANLLACVGLGWAVGALLGSQVLGLSCGVACGVLGQAGDLFESALKRIAGVKDSGSLLPGHGGLLDRVDSLLFSAPVVFALYVVLR